MKLNWTYYKTRGSSSWWWCGRDDAGEIKSTISFTWHPAGSGAAFVPNHFNGSAQLEQRTMDNGMDHGVVVRDEWTKQFKYCNGADKWARALARQWRKENV